MTYNTLWSEMALTLDDDERLVWPDMYLKNRHLYDEVKGVAHIIRNNNHPDSQWQWVYSHKLERMLESDEACAIEVIATQLVCRIRLPWNEMRYERMMSEEEFNEWREDLDVVDIIIQAWDKEDMRERYIHDLSEFHTNRDRYVVRSRKYLVVWKPNPALLEDLGVDPKIIRSMCHEV